MPKTTLPHLLKSEPPEGMSPLNIIRTETVLSKLPIHNLSKTGSFEIQITRRNDRGEVELRWEVSHSTRYGPPRQLAYKIDTIVINRRIDELGRPVPKIVRLGSLRDVAKELGLGGDTNLVRKALRQNAFTAIAAKLLYKSVDGREMRIEADFTRYSVIFAGERLPDGTQADAVHLILNEPYLEVLNNAPVRPLNYDYLKELTPAAQRFYEIVSYRIFTALKYQHPHAKLSYSDCCTFSAQQRYYDYDHFKKQMYKVHRPHLASGYLSKVSYEESIDDNGNRDWNMLYIPGPKAIAEYQAFERKRSGGGLRTIDAAIEPPLPAASTKPQSPAVNPTLLAELTRRGVSERQARKLLQSVAPDQQVLDQLEWGDALVSQSSSKIYNPPGFYSYLIKENIEPPPTFESSRHRQQVVAAASAAASLTIPLELAYDEYRRREIDRYLTTMCGSEEYQTLLTTKQKELQKQYKSSAYWTQEVLLELAEAAVRAEIGRRASLMTFEEFSGTKPAAPEMVFGQQRLF